MFIRSVSEIMQSAKSCQIDSNASLGCALKAMHDVRANALLVHDAGVFCGMVTKRDIIRPVTKGTAFMTSSRVHEVMDEDPSIMRVGTRLPQAVGQMVQSGLRQVVVVDKDLDAVGMLDWRDIPTETRDLAETRVSVAAE